MRDRGERATRGPPLHGCTQGMGYGSTSDHRSVELERACAYVGRTRRKTSSPACVASRRKRSKRKRRAAHDVSGGCVQPCSGPRVCTSSRSEQNDVSHPLLIGRICISSRSDTYEPTRRASVGGMGYGSTSARVSQTWLVLSARTKQTLGRHQSDLRVASTCAADLSCRASSSQSDRLLLSVLDLTSGALCKQPRQSACTSFA